MSKALYKDHSIETFEPFFFKWPKFVTRVGDYAKLRIDHFDRGSDEYKFLTRRVILFQNLSVKNAYVVMTGKRTIQFIHETGNIMDVPMTHRFMGPAIYSLETDGIADLRWFIWNQEYSEYDYWTKMCQMFSDKLMMCLSSDETCYYLENNRWQLPFPERLNLEVEDAETDDEERIDNKAQVVWELHGQRYVSAEKFWSHWESKGFDLKILF
jgi:hypothetical protein